MQSGNPVVNTDHFYLREHSKLRSYLSWLHIASNLRRFATAYVFLINQWKQAAHCGQETG